MDKQDLKKMAMLGIASGVIFSAAQADAAGYRSGNHDYFAGRHGCGGGNGSGGYDDDDGNGNDQKDDNESAYFTPDGELNEEGLLSQLSDESKAIYHSLDEAEKQLVLRMAKQFHDKNNALKQAQKQADTEKEQAERPKRSILRHSLFR